VQETEAFQYMMDKLEPVEEELSYDTLKLETLRREIAIAIKQLENGQYSEYNQESLPAFFEDIKAGGTKRLGQNNNL
jgi:hypothetical protein